MENEFGDRSLHVDACGMESCAPGHQYGPAVREYYLIHYIFSGCGVYRVGGAEYHLHAGQGFVIFPGVPSTYRADDEDPWQYGWLGYSGTEAHALTRWAGLAAARPVLTVGEPEEIRLLISSVIQDMAVLEQGGMSAVGGLLRFMARMAQPAADTEEGASQGAAYFRKANWYIEGNLEHGVSVSDVAAFVGLCRSQLFRVFRAEAGCGPQEWIYKVRLRRAERLLLKSTLSLEEVALSCGYTGAAQMGQAFRRSHGMSPSAYRRRYAAQSSSGC